jgi:16S rRNA (adenine(1408)-N(1))-methyltransferase
VDVGAGDGGYVLHRARSEPTTFAMGLDASPDALADGAWRAKRARLPNAAFLVDGVERLPRELAGVADEVTVHFPWGSLLRGLLATDEAVLAPLAHLLKAGGELRLLLSATDRDGFTEVTPSLLESRRSAFCEHGLELLRARHASRIDIEAAHSAWAKRLAVGRARSAVIARYRRDAT